MKLPEVFHSKIRGLTASSEPDSPMPGESGGLEIPAALDMDAMCKTQGASLTGQPKKGEISARHGHAHEISEMG